MKTSAIVVIPGSNLIQMGIPMTQTCGNVARHKADNDDKNIKTMGYILVRLKTTMNFNLSRACILKTSKHRVPFFAMYITQH